MIRKQLAHVVPRIFPALLLVGGLGLVTAEGDVVTTVGGESLQGTVTFREGGALEMASESGEKERISLADLASLDLTFDGSPWLIGGFWGSNSQWKLPEPSCDKNEWEGGDIWRAGGLLASHEAEHCGSFLPAASIPGCRSATF